MRQTNGPTPPSTCGNGMAPAVTTNPMRQLNFHWSDQQNDHTPQNKVHEHSAPLAMMRRLAGPIPVLLVTRPGQTWRLQHQKPSANISHRPEEYPSNSQIYECTLSQGFFNGNGLSFFSSQCSLQGCVYLHVRYT